MTWEIRVQCSCGNWVRRSLGKDETETREKSCWKCKTPVKAKMVGGYIRGYYKPLYGDWVETRVDVSQE